MFDPQFQIHTRLEQALEEIEQRRQAISDLPISIAVLDGLNKSARLSSTHHSTRIEGNQLSLAEVEMVVLSDSSFPGRQRDEAEVRNYYRAMEYVERLLHEPGPVTETSVMTIHGTVMTGKEQPTRYRDAQDVIRDRVSGRIVYLPPEAEDVPILMQDLISWTVEALRDGTVPAPIVAALAHYQFATVHPYFDGNGRTARLLASLILHEAGYGLKGIYSLEEYYSRDLAGYYRALQVGPSHNYYIGRATADLTAWIEYFCLGMADSFATVQRRAEEAAASREPDQSRLLRTLDPRQRLILTLFDRDQWITTAQVAQLLGLHRRTALRICNQWVENGFLIRKGQAPKSRKYGLASEFLHGSDDAGGPVAPSQLALPWQGQRVRAV